jgi:mRNA-degrading endonuclease RelE of RelBE toxin-antitoxin system
MVKDAADAYDRSQPMTTTYGLHISDDLEKRMLRYRAPVRDAIRERLQEIATGAGKARQRGKTLTPREPPLRVYVYEGYRIAYQIDGASRRVVVLNIERVPVN